MSSKLSPKFEAEMKARILKAGTLKEILDILSEYYDTENAKPGPIVKGAIILGLQKVITITNAKPKPFYS